MNIFLQGPSGVGKSTLLREALASYSTMIAGFTVQRLAGTDGETAFRAACLEGKFPPNEARYHPGLDGVFVQPGRKLDISALESVILRVEAQARDPNSKLILLDEIGGVEMTSRVFMGVLERLLSCGKPCFGVFKSKENFARTTRNLSLAPDYADLHSQLEARILAGGEIITLTTENRAEIFAHSKHT